MSTFKQAKDLVEGNLVEIPDRFVVDTPNEMIADSEYFVVESVNGGWLDNAAADDEVVLYGSYAEPIILPAFTKIEVIAEA